MLADNKLFFMVVYIAVGISQKWPGYRVSTLACKVN